MKNQLLCLIMTLLLGAASAEAGDIAPPIRWEYRIWVQPDDVNEISGKERIERELNDLGAQGWELVTVMWKKHSDRTSPDGRAIHYLKRPIPSDKAWEGGQGAESGKKVSEGG